MRVRIGVANATRELDLEVDDAEAVAEEYERAAGADDRIFWITESDGKRHGIVTEAVIYVEFEPEERRSIGFGID